MAQLAKEMSMGVDPILQASSHRAKYSDGAGGTCFFYDLKGGRSLGFSLALLLFLRRVKSM